ELTWPRSANVTRELTQSESPTSSAVPTSRTQTYSYTGAGTPVHVPFSHVSVAPTAGVPATLGTMVLAGGVPRTRMLLELDASALPALFVAFTLHESARS